MMLALSGCATGLKEKRKYLSGLDVEFNPADVGVYAARQTEVMSQLLILSGQSGKTEDQIAWRPVVDAGIDYVDTRCERYIDSIFWFNRQKNGVKNQIDILGASTAGILGATDAAAKAISLTGIAFGLGSQSVDNYGKGLLYEVDPAALRGVVEKSQAAYLTALDGATYSNRSAAMRAIRGYLALCLPATLESEINKSVNNSEFTAVEPAEGSPKANLVPHIDQVRPLPVTYSAAAVRNAEPLARLLLDAHGHRDPAKVQDMRARCWPGAGVPPDTSVPKFLLEESFATARLATQACLSGL